MPKSGFAWLKVFQQSPNYTWVMFHTWLCSFDLKLQDHYTGQSYVCSPLSHCVQFDMSHCQSNDIFFTLKFKKKKRHSLFLQRNAVSWLSLWIVVLFSEVFEIKLQLGTILEEYNSRVLDRTLTIVEVGRLPAGWIGDLAKANMRLKVLWSGKSDAFIPSEGNIGEGSPWRGIFSKACCENEPLTFW